MDPREVERLVAAAVPAEAGVWADFGAGDGTFTRALAARLAAGSRVHAVDRNERALAVLRRETSRNDVDVIVTCADLEKDVKLPGLESATLEGFVLANTLHFLSDPPSMLARLVDFLRTDGVAVLIEYDGRRPSRWVPHPIASIDLPRLFSAAALGPPRVVARTASAFGGEMYVAVGSKIRRPLA